MGASCDAPSQTMLQVRSAVDHYGDLLNSFKTNPDFLALQLADTEERQTCLDVISRAGSRLVDRIDVRYVN